MAKHGDVTAGGVHIPYNWSYADQATREAAAGFVAGDVGKLALQEDTNDLYILTATTPTWSAIGGAGGTAIYPTRATMWHDEARVTAGNAITTELSTAHPYQIDSYQNTAANGDTFTQSFMLAAGTYTFKVMGSTYNNHGIVDWHIDGVEVVTGQDWYSAGNVFGVIQAVGSISVVGSGRHVLQAVVNGKNASSSSYFLELQKYWFVPASDTTDV